MTPDELQTIKSRWAEENRYRIVALQPFEIFEKAKKDVSYLLNRLEAAEKAARGFANKTGKFRSNIAVQCPKCYNWQTYIDPRTSGDYGIICAACNHEIMIGRDKS